MKKAGLTAIVFFISIIICIAFYVYKQKGEVKRLENVGNQIVGSINRYHLENHKYPDNLDQLNITLPADVEFGYDLSRDSSSYLLGFGTGILHAHVYDSERKKWKDMD